MEKIISKNILILEGSKHFQITFKKFQKMISLLLDKQIFASSDAKFCNFATHAMMAATRTVLAAICVIYMVLSP